MKHHYIPKFYLKRWASENGRLCEFSNRPNLGVRRRWTAPGGTGYVEDLYALTGVPPHLRHRIETAFMARADQLASDALDLMYTGTARPWTVGERAWSRFVMSLLLRTPEELALFRERYIRLLTTTPVPELEEEYQLIRSPEGPPTLVQYLGRLPPEELEGQALETLIRTIDARRLGERFNNLRWAVRRTDEAAYELLTSDRPIIRTKWDGPPNRASRVAGWTTEVVRRGARADHLRRPKSDSG